jgi:hypothetical protein
MKTIATALLFILAIAGYSQNSYMKSQHFQSNFILVDSSFILLPIVWTNSGKFNDVRISTTYEYNIKNMVFYNLKTDSCRYLFSDSLQIIKQIFNYNYTYRNNNGFTLNIVKDSIHADLTTGVVAQPSRYTFGDYLLFEVINEDYNSDGALSPSDPSCLYISKKDGTGLVQVTPSHYNYKYYEYFESQNIILAVLTADSDGDKSFDNSDKEVVYKIDLADLSKSRIIVDLKVKGTK